MGLRLLIGFVTSVILWFAIIHFGNIPPDRYLWPSYSLSNISQTTTGYVVQGIESGYGDHWWDGNTGMEWYLEYKFQPTTWIVTPGGGHAAIPQTAYETGRIPISEDEYKKTTPGDPMEVSYDPWNPLINGVTGTGKISSRASFFSLWLLYPLGFITTTILVGEFMKKWLRSDI